MDTRILFVLLLIGTVGFILAALWMTLTRRDPVVERLRRVSESYGPARTPKGLIKQQDIAPEGMLKALIPDERAERTQIRLQLARAGFDGPNAVRNFFLFRLAAAGIAPAVAVVLLAARETGIAPGAVTAWMAGFEPMTAFRNIAVLVGAGFWSPTFWLNARIKARKAVIEQGFPNALDLLQISSEAGLGFDAAMTRVGHVIAPVCPAIAEEFLTCQAEILASRDRAQALLEMAERMGVDEVHGFVQVINQSMEYGTSVGKALNAYAVEMRESREMKAIEKANKLPVQMSAVMATLMLPALFLITLGPTAIKYMDAFGK